MWVEYALPGGCVQRRFGERAVRFASAEFTDAVAVRVDLPTGTRDERRVPETCGVSTYTRFGNMHVSYFFFFGNRGRKGRTGDVEDCGVIDKRKKRHTTALFASEKSSIVVFCCTCELKRNNYYTFDARRNDVVSETSRALVARASERDAFVHNRKFCRG
jgi:hypothetical protein